MAVLQRFRDKAGLAISIIIGLALLSFIIDPSTLETAMNSMSSKYDVGQISGKNISFTDFQEEVDKYTTINELLTGSSVQNEESQKQIRNAAWQSLLDKYMFIKSAKEAGITVGDEELKNLLVGDTPSPLVAGNPVFVNDAGVFDPSKVVEFERNLDSDETGRLRLYWDYLQNSIYTQQFYQKYAALCANSYMDNALMAQKSIAGNNTTANVEYVHAVYPFVPDSTVTVSDAEIKAFYKENKKMFRQLANRDVEYVMFEVVPSSKDLNDNELAFQEAYEEFGEAQNIKTFILKNSDQAYNDLWYKEGELSTISAATEEFVASHTSGVSDIEKDGATLRAVRVLEAARKSDSVYVKHILLNAADEALADSLLKVVEKGGDFSALAAQYSADKNSADQGQLGNIGWLTQVYMIPGFEGMLDATVGKPQILNTVYGKHIVVVTKKTEPVLKKKVAVLEKTATPSKETLNSFYSQANNFAVLAGKDIEGFHKAADSLKTYVHTLNHITEATSSYGAVDNAKELTRWAFDAKKGDVSPVKTINQNYFFVVALKEARKEGYTNINEVAGIIREKLLADKMADKELEKISEKTKGMTSLEEIAKALNTEVVKNEALTFSYFGGQEDPAILGAALAAPEGKVAGPVKGISGICFVKVNSRQEGTFYTAEDAKVLSAQKAQYLGQQIIPVMMEEYDVKDNRERFY